MTIKSVSFTEEETVYRINYWEIPSRIRNPESTFRYSLGCTAAIYMFDGKNSLIQLPKIRVLRMLRSGFRQTIRHILRFVCWLATRLICTVPAKTQCPKERLLLWLNDLEWNTLRRAQSETHRSHQFSTRFSRQLHLLFLILQLLSRW